MGDINLDCLIKEYFNVGLLSFYKATYGFDHERGIRFTSYAGIIMERELLSIVKREKCNRPAFLFGNFEEEGEGAKLLRKVAIEDRKDRERCEKLQTLVETVKDILTNPENPAELDERERRVLDITLFYYDKMGRKITLKEAGRRIKLSQERVRQVQNKALGKIRDLLTK